MWVSYWKWSRGQRGSHDSKGVNKGNEAEGTRCCIGVPIWGWEEEEGPFSGSCSLSETGENEGQGTSVLTDLEDCVEEAFEQEQRTGRYVLGERDVGGGL